MIQYWPTVFTWLSQTLQKICSVPFVPEGLCPIDPGLITLQKVPKQDSAQNAPDARREIFEERGVLSVRRMGEEIEATQQLGYFQRYQV